MPDVILDILEYISSCHSRKGQVSHRSHHVFHSPLQRSVVACGSKICELLHRLWLVTECFTFMLNLTSTNQLCILKSLL